MRATQSTKSILIGVLPSVVAACLALAGCGDDSQDSHCLAGEFDCADGVQCVDESVVCDGTADCSDTTDEHPLVCCDSTDFVCDSGFECIPASEACDGVDDCGDGSDELARNCCGEYDFICDNGWQCIDPSLTCDGTFDCDDTSDEYPSLCWD